MNEVPAMSVAITFIERSITEVFQSPSPPNP